MDPTRLTSKGAPWNNLSTPQGPVQPTPNTKIVPQGSASGGVAPRAQQASATKTTPAPQAPVTGVNNPVNVPQYTGGQTSAQMGNPLVFQQALLEMDKHARNVQDLQDQKNALIGVLYGSVVPDELLAKLTPDQVTALSSKNRGMIDTAVRSINDQIEGIDKNADRSLTATKDAYKEYTDWQKELNSSSSSPYVNVSVSNNNGGVGIVGGYDISKYATDPSHEVRVASLFNEYSNFSTPEELQNEISRKTKNTSPVTAEMIYKASSKFGVPPALITAIIAQDSTFGTKGKAVRTMNPGNVGNDDEGNMRTYSSWQDGVDAVAKWLSNKKAKSTQQMRPDIASYVELIKSGQYNPSDVPADKKDAVAVALADSGYATPAPESDDPLVQALKTKLAGNRNITADEAKSILAKATDEIGVYKQLKNLATTAEREKADKYGIAEKNTEVVLKAIENGDYIQSGGWFGKKFRNLANLLGSEGQNYNNAIKATFRGDTAQLRKEIFGASLTDNELLDSNAFFPTDGDTTEVLKAKLETLKNAAKIYKYSAVGMDTEELLDQYLQQQLDIVENAKSGSTAKSSNTPAATPELTKLRNQYGY